MGRKLVQETNLQNIAAAIRAKNGSSSTYKPREMADAIRALPSSSTLVPKAITENGSYSPQSENADGYSSVTVNVGRYLGDKNITRNGTFRAANDHVDGYSSVSVNVPNSYSALDEGKVVSGGALSAQTSLSVTQNGTFDTTRYNQVTVNVPNNATLVSKTITTNGTYAPSNDNADGYDWINVVVPGGFEPSDEGKVIVNGALVPQASLTVTANGIYDTTAKSSVVVNISGGGGGADYYYFDNEAGTLGVKISSDGSTVKWYFNGYTKDSDDVTIADSPLKALVPGGLYITAAYDTDKTTQIGWIGFYNGLLRTWTMDQTRLLSGTFWGTLNVTAYDGNPMGDGTITPYEEPPTQ